jgi:hypothetical protein
MGRFHIALPARPFWTSAHPRSDHPGACWPSASWLTPSSDAARAALKADALKCDSQILGQRRVALLTLEQSE